jgi:5-formyltetrahydrofolate cyclo-ligase
MSDFNNLTKSELRKYFKQVRAAISKDKRDESTDKSIVNLHSLISKLDIKSIAIYYAINSEMALHETDFVNIQTALPIINENNNMQFCAWQKGDDLERGIFGIMRPLKLNIFTPEAIITPLLAVDAEGFRLGYGGGYYDRYFSQNPNVQKIGIGFAEQFCQKLPHEAHDIKLNYFVSENKISEF